MMAAADETAAPLASALVRAGWPGRSRRIALSNGHAGLEAFRKRLRELGYVEGQALALVVRDAEGRAERYSELATELVRLRVDIIVVQGNVALAALKQATRTIPIVMAQIGDPVGAGFVASLARPEGNITGLSNMAEGVNAKWVELLKEVAPKATRLAVLLEPQNVTHANIWSEIQRAGRALSVTPVAWEVRGPDEIERAFSAMGTKRIGAVITVPHPPAVLHRRLIVGLLTKHRLPAIYAFRELAEAGCLMSTGRTWPICGAAPLTSWTRSSKEPSRRTCPWISPRRSSWSSTSRPRRPSASRSPSPSCSARPR